MSEHKPIQGFIEELLERQAFIRFPTLGVTAEFNREHFSEQDDADLFDGAYVELDMEQKKLRMIRIPPPTDEEVQEILKLATDWFGRPLGKMTP